MLIQVYQQHIKLIRLKILYPSISVNCDNNIKDLKNVINKCKLSFKVRLYFFFILLIKSFPFLAASNEQRQRSRASSIHAPATNNPEPLRRSTITQLEYSPKLPSTVCSISSGPLVGKFFSSFSNLSNCSSFFR